MYASMHHGVVGGRVQSYTYLDATRGTYHAPLSALLRLYNYIPGTTGRGDRFAAGDIDSALL